MQIMSGLTYRICHLMLIIHTTCFVTLQSVVVVVAIKMSQLFVLLLNDANLNKWLAIGPDLVMERFGHDVIDLQLFKEVSYFFLRSIFYCNECSNNQSYNETTLVDSQFVEFFHVLINSKVIFQPSKRTWLTLQQQKKKQEESFYNSQCPFRLVAFVVLVGLLGLTSVLINF